MLIAVAVFLPVSCLAWDDLVLESTGSQIVLLVISMATWTHLPGLLLPLPTHTSAGDPQTLTDRSRSVSCRVTVPFPSVLVCARFCLHPLRVESLFPQSCGGPIIKSCWPSKSYSLGISSTLARSLAWESDMGPRTFTIVQERLWYYWVPVCGSPTRQL